MDATQSKVNRDTSRGYFDYYQNLAHKAIPHDATMMPGTQHRAITELIANTLTNLNRIADAFEQLVHNTSVNTQSLDTLFPKTKKEGERGSGNTGHGNGDVSYVSNIKDTPATSHNVNHRDVDD